LGALKDAGKVGMIGVSNTYDVKILEALQKVRKVDVVQNRWYQGNDWDKEVCKFCIVNGIQYQLRIDSMIDVVDLPNAVSRLGRFGL
jgi:aryl-alcohol dehydrogenase-like predicted oxidoreductase